MNIGPMTRAELQLALNETQATLLRLPRPANHATQERLRLRIFTEILRRDAELFSRMEARRCYDPFLL